MDQTIDGSMYTAAPAIKIPMRKKPSVMTARELETYEKLIEAFPPSMWMVLTQVSYSAFIEAEWKRRWEVDKYFIDFLLCNKQGVPICAIELDDSSHNRAKVKEKDGYKDAVFAEARLPIVRLKSVPKSTKELLIEVLGKKVLKTITD
jgi:very-short-patch-repair endonuclease